MNAENSWLKKRKREKRHFGKSVVDEMSDSKWADRIVKHSADSFNGSFVGEHVDLESKRNENLIENMEIICGFEKIQYYEDDDVFYDYIPHEREPLDSLWDTDYMSRGIFEGANTDSLEEPHSKYNWRGFPWPAGILCQG